MIAASIATTVASLAYAGLLSVSSPIDFDGKADRDSIDVVATDVSGDGSVHRPRDAGGVPVSVEYRRMPASLCHTGEVMSGMGQVGSCRQGEVEGGYQVVCAVGEVALEPVFSRSWTNNPDGTISGLSDWVLHNAGDCVGSVDLAPLVEAEFARLPVAPSPVTVQPGRGWTVVNIPTITYTSAHPQVFTTTLLGIALTIEAVPRDYTWDYGDATDPVVTTDPGAPYPDHTVHHTYTHPTDPNAPTTITLTTTWTGRFQITGTPTWTPITGTATTTTTAPPLTIHEARSRLVTDPLD
ncbi:hypothetical protein [Oerskovia turbata]